MGGEKGSRYREQVRALGSPPRGRGKALLAECRHGVVGITPAWAGKRPQTAHRVKPQQDHPRVGGEKPYFAGVRAGPAGSPPRGRGKVRTRKCAASQHGITPAWAGKSCGARLDAGHRRDHPRVGGEKTTDRPQGQATAGSPPRGRGKAPQRHRGVEGGRITPAWAGKRRSTRSATRKNWDHPRVGGEKGPNVDIRPAKMGSPPRGRGKD